MRDTCSEYLHIVKLDVTKADDIEKAREYVEKVHQETGCGEINYYLT